MARHAKTITMSEGDTKPGVVGHIKLEETGEAKDVSAADSVDFMLYDLDADAAATGFANDASVTDATAGEVKYQWATDGSETVAGRYVGYFIIYWAAADAQPQRTTVVYINIVEAHKRTT